MDRSGTPRQGSLRNSSPPGRFRTGGRAQDGALTARSRRVSRLENALEDARANSGYSPFCTPRIVHKKVPVKSNNPAVDTLQSVYDRVEQRNSALTDPPDRVPTLSTTQLQWAEQAVQTFVGQMRNVADAADMQVKADIVRALANDVMVSETDTNAKVMQPIYTSRQQNHEVEALNQLDDISSWYSEGKEIGRGTFGRVRFATHRLSGTPVAIKSYARLHGARSCLAVDAIGKQNSSGDALEWRRVRQEVNVLSRLHAHPNIMRYIEVFETPTRMHAVTEYVKGTSLCDILRRAPGQRLPEARAKEIFRQIAAGVGAIHAQRVIHRDLKLENILQDESSGHVTIIDFGFSDFEDCGDPQMLDPADDMAPKKRLRKKNFCGTPSYMAPEVVASERYDGRPVDVWSLGVLLYVMLCGKFPFQGVSFHQLYQKLRSGSQQLVLPPALSVEARALLQAVLIVDPAKRPSASGLYCCSWLQESQNHWSSDLQPRNALRLSFETWSGITPAICSALTELYGVQLSPSSLDQFKRGLQQLKRLKAFIDLATVQSSCHFQKIVDTLSLPPSLSSDSIDSQENEKTESKVQIVESSTRHKQQLEKLIGLVKASLAQNTFV